MILLVIGACTASLQGGLRVLSFGSVNPEDHRVTV